MKNNILTNTRILKGIKHFYKSTNLLLIISFFIFIALNNISLISQDDNLVKHFNKIGAFASFNPQFYQADFQRLPGIPNCCPQFDDGNGSAISIGGIYEFIFPSFSLESRASISFAKGSFNSSEPQIFGVNGFPVEGKFEHIIDVNFSNVNLMAGVNYKIYDRLMISLFVGGAYYLNSHFNQIEKISSPKANITFLDSNGMDTGENTRNKISGPLPDLNKIQFLTQFNIGFEIPLNINKSFILKPELGIEYILTPMIRDLNWRTFSIKIGLSIYYSSYKNIDNATMQNLDNDKNEKDISEIDKLKQQKEIADLESNKIQEILKEEQQAKKLAELANEKSMKELKDELERQANDSLIIVKERDDFNKMILEENKNTGKICNCFVIMYISTKDKNEAEKVLKYLHKNQVENVSIKIYTEPYLQEKYFRVQSDCYSDHLMAFDDRYKNFKQTDYLNIVPYIICNR